MIDTLYTYYQKTPRVFTDTRLKDNSGIFIALSGPNFDGNRFAIAAIQGGASLAVVSDKRLKDHPKCLYVEDTLKALQALAAHHRDQLDIILFAVTGTNGKTTTKDLICEALSSQYNCIATTGNLNNHIGVPLTLLQLDADVEIAVIEMGASAPGEISRLCTMARPTHGMITNIGRAHILGFGDIQRIRQTKAELYDYLIANDGVFYKNGDEDTLDYLTDQKQVIRIGSAADNDVVVTSDDIDGHSCVSFMVDEKRYPIETRLMGVHNTQNLKMAVGIAIHLGVTPHKISAALSAYAAKNNRSELITRGANKIILDAYNANPSSMLAVLKYFGETDHPKKVLILGDMLELGHQSANLHQEIVDYLKNYTWEAVYLVGSCFSRTTAPFVQKYNDVHALKSAMSPDDYKDAFILIKGSRGIALEKLLS